METPTGRHHRLSAAIALAFMVGLPALGLGQTVMVSRRLVRFDGRPAAGAKVRLLDDYGTNTKKTDQEVVADADGSFSVEVSDAGIWSGHLIVTADGCAATCEVAVSGTRKSDSDVSALRLGAPFAIEGRTVDADGRPLAGATVSLVWAQLEGWNATPFNSVTTARTTTPGLVAHSDAEGRWSMPGVDFVMREKEIPARVTFEAAADGPPPRASKLDLKLDGSSGAAPRKHIPLDFKLTPPVRVAGKVVNSVTGEPVADAGLYRGIVFTTLPGSSALTDATGAFELRIPGPVTGLWFDVYDHKTRGDDPTSGNRFASARVSTASREQAASDWPDANDLAIRVRPMVAVSGTVQDADGKPPHEPLELTSKGEDRIDARWNQVNTGMFGSEIASDGSFDSKLPVGSITLGVCRPPQSMGSMIEVGAAPRHYRLQQEAEIPPGGMSGLLLRASRIDDSK